MKRRIFVFAILTAFFIEGIFSEEILVRVKPGPKWKTRPPQLAVWVCDAKGNFLGTIFVTNSAAKKSWKFSPKNGRPESLPVWYFASKTNPAKNEKPSQDADAVSGATPKTEIAASKNFDLQAGCEYFVKAEVNASFDYNDFWTKKNSFVNGQPSLVYAKKFLAIGGRQEFLLEFLGTGSVDGGTGDVHFDGFETLTSAKEILEGVAVVVE